MRTVLVFAAAALLCAAQVKLPSYSREVLPNGAVLLLMPRAGVPLVHFRVMVRGGAESEPRELAGVAGMTAQLLRRGTAKRTADQFSEELDSLGGSFGALLEGSTSSATTINAEFLKKDFDHGLDLVADALLHPTFPEAEVKKAVARAIDGQKSLKDNPPSAIRNYFLPFFYGRNHPFGNPADETTLGRIGRAEVNAYHQRLYCGRNLIVALTGDFDAAAAKTALARVFGAAPAGTAFAWPAAPELPRKSKLLLIDKPDATQTYFEIAQPGISRSSDDRTRMTLINTLFGGRFTSMLNDELRVNSGLTYGASSILDTPRVPGAISISTYTKVETTVRAMDMALDVLKRLNTPGISAEQLASVKAYTKGLYPTRALETIDQLASVLTSIELYGLTRDEVDGYFGRIDAVSLADAKAAAGRYYRPDGLVFVVLGPAAKIRDQVKKYAPTVTEVSITDAGWGSR